MARFRITPEREQEIKQRLKNSRFYNWLWTIHNDKQFSRRELLYTAYHDEPYVKVLLYYCYNPRITFPFKPIAIARKDWKDSRGIPTDSNYKGKNINSSYKAFIAILEAFRRKELNQKETREKLYTLFSKCNRYTRWAYNCVLKKSFNYGFSYVRISSWFPELIPKMASKKFTTDITSLSEIPREMFPVYVAAVEKERAFIVSKAVHYSIVTPNGLSASVNEDFQVELPKNIVLEGYFTWEHRVIKEKLVRKKNRRFLKKHQIVERTPIFWAYDYIPLSDYEKDHCEIPYSVRRTILNSLDMWGNQIRKVEGQVLTEPTPLKVGRYMIRSLNSQWGKDNSFIVRVSSDS